MSDMISRTLAAACFALVCVALPASAQETVRIRGTIESIDGPVFVVKNRDGAELRLTVTDKPLFVAIVKGTMADIKPGMFVGSTGVTQEDGTQKAIEVHIFPESMRGTGEGHRPMDTEPGSTMTNATVTNVTAAPKSAPRSTMTNATVANVAPGGSTRKLTLQYKGGEKTVVVGDGVPVVMVEAGDPSMLVPGAHIVVTAAKQLDGTLTTDRISVGKNGIVPPI